MECEQRDFKGVWFPKKLWLDKRLNMLEKGICVEIDSLDDGINGCFASNEYLAEFCGCSERKVSDAISKLVNLGYICIKSFDGRTRKINSCLEKNAGQSSKICEADTQNLRQINIKDYNKENYTKESQNRNEQPSPTPTFLQNTDDSITPKVRKGTANIVSNEDIEKYFETTYSIYPRKVSKQQAKKTYEHKFRGLESDEARKLAIRIYKSLERQIALWQAENKGNGRELEYIPHFSSWLNDNIEDSKNFKKGR